MINWQCFHLHELSSQHLHDLLKLRIDIFVVEQNCPYPELDGRDNLPEVYQIIGFDGDNIVACARILAAGISYDNVSIGRVAIAPQARGEGLAHTLIEKAINYCQQYWPERTIDIGAQEHLQPLYQQHGFCAISATYLEDGIPHIDMRLIKSTQ